MTSPGQPMSSEDGLDRGSVFREDHVNEPMKTRIAKSGAKEVRSRAVAARRRADASSVIDLVPSLLRLRTILVPVDFSKEGDKALQYALRFADQFGSKLVLLHVVEPVVYGGDFGYLPTAADTGEIVRAIRIKLDTLCVERGIAPRLLEKTLVLTGKPFVEITDAARSLKADLIVISTHGYTGLKHAVMGSTSERVVRHAPCPVLVVRQHEREFIHR